MILKLLFYYSIRNVEKDILPLLTDEGRLCLKASPVGAAPAEKKKEIINIYNLKYQYYLSLYLRYCEL